MQSGHVPSYTNWQPRARHLHVAQHSAILDHATLDQHPQGCGLLALDGAPFLCMQLVDDCAVRNLLAESTCNAKGCRPDKRPGSSQA